MSHQPPQLDQDEILAEALALQLWEEYWTDRSPEETEERDRYRRLFSEAYKSSESSPMTLMFISFLGGLKKGISLWQTLNEQTA